jgi:hypothetical protein
MLLNLNPVMSIIANVPAAIVSTVRSCFHFVRLSWICFPQIVACRIVRRLSNFTSQGPEIFAYVLIMTSFHDISLT